MGQARRRLLASVPDDPPFADTDLQEDAVSDWTEGQKECRAAKRHDWKGLTIDVLGDPEKLGVIWYVTEQCAFCKNRRHADHVRVARGIRKAGKWIPEYREQRNKDTGKMVPYLLKPGSGRLSEDVMDGLTEHRLLKRSYRVVPQDD